MVKGVRRWLGRGSRGERSGLRAAGTAGSGDYFFFPEVEVALVVLALERTQRKPMKERGWFWYSQLRQAERMYDMGSFHEPPRTLLRFST